MPHTDDIGIAAHTQEYPKNIEVVLQRNEIAGLKLSMNERTLGRKKNFRENGQQSRNRSCYGNNYEVFKQSQTSHVSNVTGTGFVNFYRQLLPRPAEKLKTLYQHMQKDIKFQLTSAIRRHFFDINENLAKTAGSSLRLPVPDQKLIMCGESEHAACLLLIKDYTTSNEEQTGVCTPAGFGSKRFTNGKISEYAQKF